MTPDKCPECGESQCRLLPHAYMCGSWVEPSSGQFNRSIMCVAIVARNEERAAHQHEEVDHAATLRKLVLATELISKLKPYLRHRYGSFLKGCRCGLHEIIMDAGKAVDKDRQEEKP